MAIRVALNHFTQYQYDRRVALSPHVFRLRPAPHSRTPIVSYSLNIKPEPHFIHWQQDPFGNYLARVVFPEQAEALTIEVDLVAELVAINPFDFFVEEYAEKYPFPYDESLKAELTPYLELRDNGPLLTARLAAVDRSPVSIVNFLVAINQQLQQDISYNVRMEPGVQSCETTLTLKSGSCRDTAWLLVQMMRHLGLAARFVSGYLVQLAPDVKPLDGPAGPSADFTDLHAWAEVYIPGAGWIGLDPTSGLFAGEGHIPLACTPDPAGAAPVTGATDVCEVEFVHRNSVLRVHEDPRVTKPYSDEQWQHVMALGRRVDSQLVQDDVRLTMGGEPTFISVENTEAPEWNTDADGPHKRTLAHALFSRMCEHFSPGGVRLYGQGKWYPGEPLPRWQYTSYWRKDGVPLWCDPQWLAKPVGLLGANDEASDEPAGATEKDAQRLLATICSALHLPEHYLITTYEDVAYYVWREQQLPVDIDPTRANLKDGLERQRLAALLARGLGTPAGYVLPLKWQPIGNYWQSCGWRLRAAHLYLIPGDSPLGLRLPLDSLEWAPRERLQDQPLDPFAARPALEGQPYINPPLHPDAGFIQMALSVEARAGKLCVFLPPLPQLEAFVQLLSVIEFAAKEIGMPVLLEGYDPPRDPRLAKFMVTPDPGVIEVNVQPASSWQELVDNTTALYEFAHQTRLGTEKFMLDGRQTGTGGGNHVTMGGATPTDSPLLRRPDVLRSLITFWQHHPGLSYVFSGLFIGPTSQAPRVDEGRDELLYELEIAFEQLPKFDELTKAESWQPWLVDRVLRNLLVDITGNTHRSEFCIDKLYSPDSATGRLGLLEFRGFEMPPHARMSLVQMLLLRTLVAMFWRKPYHHRLVRWGTSLHDKFLLPHFVREDLRQVTELLQQEGYPFCLDWLDPFLEFRFPVYGRVQIAEVGLELRTAIEPWHVMGEETTNVGTSRFVDSSVERVQVKVTGICSPRYVLTCNGRRVPMRETGIAGEYVAGVRYRAWQPPSCLHPTIGVQSPLVFDLIDTWNGRAIGGCAYHVMHPGGRNYKVFPINSLEAEGRRITRFWGHGHTPGELSPAPEVLLRYESEARFYPQGAKPATKMPPLESPNGEYPTTLDLRNEPWRF